MVKAGAEVNARMDNGWTPLIWAALFNPSPEIVAALLDAGADAKAKGAMGERAIDYARDNPALKDTEALKRLDAASR